MLKNITISYHMHIGFLSALVHISLKIVESIGRTSMADHLCYFEKGAGNTRFLFSVSFQSSIVYYLVHTEAYILFKIL